MIGIYLFVEIYLAVLPHNLMHLRYGDDLMFHNYLSQLYEKLTNHGVSDFFSVLKPSYAYSSFYWFINFTFIYIASFFNSSSLLTLSPFIVSLLFFLASLFVIIKIYKLYFTKRSTVLVAFFLCLFIPMMSHSAIRFHNYSMTLFFSSLLFYLIKKWNFLDYKRIIILALTSSILISTKLNGAFIGIACLGLVYSKRIYFIKENATKLLVFSLVFIFSFLLFMQPDFFWHMILLDSDFLIASINDYITMVKLSLSGMDVDHLINLYSLKDHYLSLPLSLFYMMGFLSWIIFEHSKTRVESIMIFLNVILCSSYLLLTGRFWHSPTYLVGICFLVPLSLKGYEYIKNKIIRYFLLATILFLSFYHFIDKYHLMHARDLYISKGSSNYLLLKQDQDIFIKKFPQPENYNPNLRLNCFIYSFCPWIRPLVAFDYSIVYHPEINLLRESDYIFVNDKRWPDQTKFYLNQYEVDFMKTLLSTLKIENSEYEIIYQSEYIKVLKRK